MPGISENAQLMLGAYAVADAHTLRHQEVLELSQGAIGAEAARRGLAELAAAGLAEVLPDGGYRLTKEGMELTLKLQQALNQRGG